MLGKIPEATLWINFIDKYLSNTEIKPLLYTIYWLDIIIPPYLLL